MSFLRVELRDHIRHLRTLEPRPLDAFFFHFTQHRRTCRHSAETIVAPLKLPTILEPYPPRGTTRSASS